MELLLAALGTFFVVEFASHFISLRGYQEMAIEFMLACGATGLTPLSDTETAASAVLLVFAVASLAHVLRAVFRLVQAWADRMEAANMREVLQQRRPRV